MQHAQMFEDRFQRSVAGELPGLGSAALSQIRVPLDTWIDTFEAAKVRRHLAPAKAVAWRLFGKELVEHVREWGVIKELYPCPIDKRALHRCLQARAAALEERRLAVDAARRKVERLKQARCKIMLFNAHTSIKQFCCVGYAYWTALSVGSG